MIFENLNCVNVTDGDNSYLLFLADYDLLKFNPDSGNYVFVESESERDAVINAFENR